MNTVNATEPSEESVDALDTSNGGEGKGNVIICDSIFLCLCLRRVLEALYSEIRFKQELH